jgi:hypothetical protein
MIPLGTTNYATIEETRAAAREAQALRQLGHAVAVHETYDHANQFLSSYAFHALTCRACQEIKQEALKGNTDGFKVG